MRRKYSASSAAVGIAFYEQDPPFSRLAPLGADLRIASELLGERPVRVRGAQAELHLLADETELLQVVTRVQPLRTRAAFRYHHGVAFFPGTEGGGRESQHARESADAVDAPLRHRHDANGRQSRSRRRPRPGDRAVRRSPVSARSSPWDGGRRVRNRSPTRRSRRS